MDRSAISRNAYETNRGGIKFCALGFNFSGGNGFLHFRFNAVCLQHNVSSSVWHLLVPLIIHPHVRLRRKSASYYLVYLDIWLLLFRTVPALILLITLTNTASPVWHKSKQNPVVAPSLGPNLNISAGVKSGTENPYGFCGQSLRYCEPPGIVLVLYCQSSKQKG